MASIEFGFYPKRLDLVAGQVRVSTCEHYVQAVGDVLSSPQVEDGWYYAPPKLRRDASARPYCSRVFPLPTTHSLEHEGAESAEHLSFLIWVLGFLAGFRLTETEAGFLDATPVVKGKLHDMVLLGSDAESRALSHADRFWRSESKRPRVPKALTGVIHAYWLAQSPHALSFERFIYLYTALDGCHYVHSLMHDKDARNATHSQRVAELCSAFDVAVPPWANSITPESIASRRNETLHEGLFFDEPLGFSVYGGKAPTAQSQHTLLEMKNLVSRLVCGLLGLPDTGYIRSPINDRQRHEMKL